MGIYKLLGEVIKNERVRLNLTQEELGKKCALTKSDISRLEHSIGNPQIEKIEKVFFALKLNIKEIKYKKTNQ